MAYALACRPDVASSWLDRPTSSDTDWRFRYVAESLIGRSGGTALELATLQTALLAYAFEIDGDLPSSDMLSAGAEDVYGYGQPSAYHASAPTYPSSVGALLKFVREPQASFDLLGERCDR